MKKIRALKNKVHRRKNRISFLIAFHREGFYLSLMRVCWKFNPCFFPLSLLFISKHLRAFDFPFEKYRHITKQTQIPFDALQALSGWQNAKRVENHWAFEVKRSGGGCWDSKYPKIPKQ
eukprot:TRINITY_DN3163_c0_g1_i3.p3 TRINITY_DN3163_c0_g1~~TRINITY_DN3163_c0_g1_i3.p3  ORF type:complete len:119 (+),score=4.72 TRINITY_DN3163_c0_g1_i3:234-590(+)